MSRTIDPTTPVEELSDDELIYLYDRDDPRVSAALMQKRGLVAFGDDNPARYLQNMPNYGDANTKAKSPDDLVPADDYEDHLGPLPQNLTKPQLVGEDDEEEDAELIEVPDDTDYEAWTNEQRRAELADRGLSVAGNKEALIARLRESDKAQNKE
jgi:hypothetical protein